MAKSPKAAATTEKPVPSQAKADEIKAEAETTVADPEAKPTEKAKKGKEPGANPDAPYPSQADLDAMRAGTYDNREMKSV